MNLGWLRIEQSPSQFCGSSITEKPTPHIVAITMSMTMIWILDGKLSARIDSNLFSLCGPHLWVHHSFKKKSQQVSRKRRRPNR